MLNTFASNSGFSRKCFLRTKAFTLIELLVVIAIIALLLSVIVPALNLAKRKAASAVCLANVRNLSLAWYSYQEANDGEIVNPNTTNIDSNGSTGTYPGWVINPFRIDGDDYVPQTDPVTDEDEIRGIEKGALYTYLEDPDVYHCPADNQRKSINGDGSKIFRTYSSPQAFNIVRKFLGITQPGLRINFVEEHEGRNWNQGSWNFYNMAADGFNEWRDPVGKNHGDSGVLGFCDGHAEVHKWQTPYTLKRIEYYFDHPGISGYGSPGLNDEYPRLLVGAPAAEYDLDIAYVAKGWADR